MDAHYLNLFCDPETYEAQTKVSTKRSRRIHFSVPFTLT